jgi:pimeloyl-ACP methyl ester carboxylesterase
LVLHRDIGGIAQSPFYAALARHYTVILPSHPGFDGAERPPWLRSVRDLAVLYRWFLHAYPGLRDVDSLPVVGLGFGGWIAAELATLAPNTLRHLMLVAPMGIRSDDAEIADQALLSHVDYVRRGFANSDTCNRIFGVEPALSQLEQWDINREMTFRLAWKPYMHNPSLPHLLGAVDANVLIVWGTADRIVPFPCATRFTEVLRHSRLDVFDDAGHFVELERPTEVAATLAAFVAAS